MVHCQDENSISVICQY